MGPVTTVIMDCLKDVKKEIFTAQDLYDFYDHDGDITYKAFHSRVNALCKIGTIIKLERNLFKKPFEKEPEEKTFNTADLGQSIVEYINNLETTNADLKKETLHLTEKNKNLVEKCNIENNKMYQNLEHRLQDLHIKFREKQQELINKINVIRKLKDLPHITIEKHKMILKEQAEKSTKCIQELLGKIETHKISFSKIPKELFARISTFKL